MNKNFLSSAFLAMSMLSFYSLADQVQINITAKVTAKTCAVSSKTSYFLVNLATGNLRDAVVGVPFSESSFTINLEDCPLNITTAHVNFSAESDTDMPNLLKIANDSDSDATGVAIGLYDKNGKNIDIRSNATDFLINHAEAINYLYFSAAYLITSDKALPGKVKSFAFFEISYD
ncbi:TPA: type 1 fimbrial protein [Serratia fonticola]|nr:type 1 fimbrial protein [Serratia fonticola]